tara:strand:+ start:1505 stop:1627 length:123 start_codon:yes stop_codon:yes gene_type:complete
MSLFSLEKLFFDGKILNKENGEILTLKSLKNGRKDLKMEI